jgi:hypothetical protein
MSYDSKKDTAKHRNRVRTLLNGFCVSLNYRGRGHDASKTGPEEKPIFDEFTPKLKDCAYGSKEYKEFLAAMKPALDHHYAKNDHHPEHFENGINGMSLFALVEMFMDWKAASERHESGSMEQSIKHNTKRFDLSPQLTQIFENTRKELNWK